MTVIHLPSAAERAAAAADQQAEDAAAIDRSPEIATTILMACDELTRDMVALAVNPRLSTIQRRQLLAIVNRAADQLLDMEEAVAKQ